MHVDIGYRCFSVSSYRYRSLPVAGLGGWGLGVGGSLGVGDGWGLGLVNMDRWIDGLLDRINFWMGRIVAGQVEMGLEWSVGGVGSGGDLI